MFRSNMSDNSLLRNCALVYGTLGSFLTLASGHLRIKHLVTITDRHLARRIGCAHGIVVLEEEGRAATGQVKNNNKGHTNQMGEFRLVPGHNPRPVCMSACV